MKTFNINKKEGILFWVTGLAGSGQTSIARYLLPKIQLIEILIKRPFAELAPHHL